MGWETDFKLTRINFLHNIGPSLIFSHFLNNWAEQTFIKKELFNLPQMGNSFKLFKNKRIKQLNNSENVLSGGDG